jgi:hypothetical protein
MSGGQSAHDDLGGSCYGAELLELCGVFDDDGHERPIDAGAPAIIE